MTSSTAHTPARGWREAVAIYAHPRVVTFLFLGFSAGLPFLLVFSTLSAWLKRSEVSLATIGFASWIGITYSVKFVWSPVVDRVPLPLLTRWLQGVIVDKEPEAQVTAARKAFRIIRRRRA